MNKAVNGPGEIHCGRARRLQSTGILFEPGLELRVRNILHRNRQSVGGRYADGGCAAHCERADGLVGRVDRVNFKIFDGLGQETLIQQPQPIFLPGDGRRHTHRAQTSDLAR